ncbi:IucA/IucC family protein [Paenibacillus alba]|uniref:IucA/IucC family protein n=1 Tax=Paenibacillus alba TaxID=1197127 RepID=A0ABU6GER2_9BACL|nr:IucA/IucC family protein [Paenibacillus alba]MEC0231687.1 IucA/IucC family protein [Paenibacillus alba]
MLYKYGTRSFQDVILAEQAALRGLLNSYLREKEINDPRCEISTLEEEDFAKETIDFMKKPDAKWFKIVLPLTQTTIVGLLSYYSITGQHQYGSNLYVSSKGLPATQKAFIAVSPQQIVELLLLEVSYNVDVAMKESLLQGMREQIANSIRRTAIYVRHAQLTAAEAGDRPLSYTRSEQSMVYGHPFHPTPKSSEGFTDIDLSQYAPEMGAVFALHYMAVSKELLCEEWIGQRPMPPSTVVAAAQIMLGNRLEAYTLLPMHPWQMKYVCQQSHVQALIHQSKLIDLGPLGLEEGQQVYPTSSVRTVWDSKERLFYKLPLHVRITNFIRENTVDQVRRTMDASLILHAFQSGRKADMYPGMDILAETGFQTIHVPDISVHEQEQLFASFAVVYRQAEQLTMEEQAACFVVAALLEQPPDGQEPLLFKAVRQSNQGFLPNWEAWLATYLKLSMLPLLHMFGEWGISLEAHVQNSLIVLDQGAPIRYYVRDLEGISVNRSLAEKHGWTPQLIPADSPVLYTEAEAWKRLKYYFFVNHLGALIHTIARCNEVDEAFYWQIVRRVLMHELTLIEANHPSRGYLQDLVDNPVFPAKANFISRFEQRSEAPDYVQIPNPIYHSGRDV